MEIGNRNCLRVIVTGPESTGKTNLCEGLWETFGGVLIREYAREYIENLGRAYTYEDVLTIAQKQVHDYDEILKAPEKMVFIDTHLIITKVWFRRVFGTIPGWINEQIRKTRADLYLLCRPDIPWIADNIRENGGKTRESLFHEYETELQLFGCTYEIISGSGKARLEKAISGVERFIQQH